MESKYSKEQITKYIENLIDKSEKAIVFPNKCGNLSSMLKNIRDCINEFQKEINQNNLEILGKYLEDIYKIINKLQTKDSFWSYLHSNDAILDIVNEINDKMVKIDKLLNMIDCKGSFTLPSDDLSQDLGAIDDLLYSTLRMITERRPELSNDIKQNKKTIMKDENDSSEDMTEIIKKYQYYRIKKTDFKYLSKKIIDSNNVFTYYKGQMKKDKQNITILELEKDYNSIFDRLISVLTIIDHPYIESFKGFYANESKITIITNRDGDRLSNLIYKKSDLKSGDLTILAFKIAEAMAYLHSKSIIHRNLSTSNIYVTKTEEGLNPNVVGFRNSRFFPDKKESYCTVMNIDSQIPISFFRAPEFEEKGIYNEKVDVFAFSGILYEILMGKVPFDDVKKREKVVNLIHEGERPTLPDNLPDDLKSLIKSCWDHDAQKRPSFSQICSTMIEKRIILPFDEESKEKINQFYDGCKNKKLTKDDCIKTIETIKSYISKAFQFTYEFEEIRKVLHTYQDKLNIPSYFYNKDKTEIDFKNQNKIDNLYNNLMELQNIVFNNNEDQFCSYLDSFKDKNSNSKSNSNSLARKTKKDSLVDFNPYQTPAQIEESMRKIYNSMKELGFDNILEYNTNSEDLAHDLQSISFLLVDFQKYAGSSVFESQIEDIKTLRKEKKLDENISKDMQYDRLNDLLSQYRKVNRDDFEISSLMSNKETVKIYEGIRKSENKHVLIKEILDTSNLLSLQTEITNLTRLKHKSVATFIGYNLSKTDNSVWLITDNYTTKLLYDVIDENQMSGNDMTEVAFKIAKGMEYITSKSLLHHDLNTKCIVMEDNKNPKIMRFNYQLNLQPETIPSNKCNEKSDVYSFGSILYEMYSGHNNNNNRDYTYEFFTKGEISLFEKPIHDALKKLIEKCWLEDESKRPTFQNIIDEMKINKIMFPGSDENKVREIYGNELIRLF